MTKEAMLVLKHIEQIKKEMRSCDDETTLRFWQGQCVGMIYCLEIQEQIAKKEKDALIQSVREIANPISEGMKGG